LVKDDLYAYMITFPALLEKVPAASIGWIDVPVEVTGPKIQFKCVSDPILYQSDDRWQRWRFYIIHADKEECAATAIILKGILHRCYGLFSSTYIDYIALIDEFPIELRDDQNYEIYQDYRILYH
jgi:hypothetical protein